MKKIAVSKKYAFAIALILCLAIACLVPSICFSTAAGQNAENFFFNKKKNQAFLNKSNCSI